MMCVHCGLHIIPAPELNGCSWRHETTLARACTYTGDTWAEPEVAAA